MKIYVTSGVFFFCKFRLVFCIFWVTLVADLMFLLLSKITEKNYSPHAAFIGKLRESSIKVKI